MSVEAFTKLIPRIVVAPITSKPHPEFRPLRVPAQTSTGKIDGFICLDPDSIGAAQAQDELTLACKNQCKAILKRNFGL
jgi:hypothetical protein